MTDRTRLHPGDLFPALTLALPGDRTLRLPGALAGHFSVILFYRGAWCPYCNAQLRAFLVGNAVRHARTDGSRLELRLEAAGTWLRIEVSDGDPRPPQPRAPSGLEESGFGFVLVEALAGKWGVRETAAGKAVWIELTTEQADEPGDELDAIPVCGAASEKG